MRAVLVALALLLTAPASAQLGGVGGGPAPDTDMRSPDSVTEDDEDEADEGVASDADEVEADEDQADEESDDEPLTEEDDEALDELNEALGPESGPREGGEPDGYFDPSRPGARRPAEPRAERESPPFWGTERPFLSGTVDLGFLYLQPRFHAGWGVPHHAWIGAEIDPILSGSGIGVYGGIRGEIPYGDLRVGARYRYNWTRSFLEAVDGYDHITFRDRTGPNASYLSAEAQLSLDVPVEGTAFTGELTATYVVPFEQGYALYEDTLRVIIVAPGWVWSAAVGWRFHFGPDDAFSIEPAVELAHLVQRDELVLRVGLRAAITLWPDLQVRLIALPAIVSPDSLGGAGGHAFLLGLRYRWATDAPRFGDD